MTIKEANEKYIVDEEVEFLGAPVGSSFPEGEGPNVSGYESIQVELLSFPDYKQWVDSAFYASLATWDTTPYEPVTKMLKEASFEEKEKKLLYMLSKRPISVALEGAVFTFKIVGVPRTMTHQIVRHRQMSFGQQSLRVSSCFADPVRIPQKILEAKERNQLMVGHTPAVDLIREYNETVTQCRELYKKMIDTGVPMEQARNIMPMGTLTKIAATMRLRDMIDYFRGRTSGITQDEHTYMVCLLAQEVEKKCPEFFAMIEERCSGLKKTMEKYLNATQ